MSVEEIFQGEKLQNLSHAKAIAIQAGTPLSEAMKELHAVGRGHFLVYKEEELVGIVTERDILRKLLGPGKPLSTPVDEIMNSPVRSLPIDASPGQAIRLMVTHKYRHIPLTDADGKVVATLRIQSLMNYMVEAFPKEILNLPPKPHQRMSSPEGG